MNNGMSPKDPQSPFVSVVIPTYNCAPFLAEALQSVFEQDYPSFEVIVVDDASTDHTPEIIKLFGERVAYLRLSENSGPAAARNRGIAESRGEYLALLDADDVWLPGKLRAQMNFLVRNPEFKLVYGRWARWNPDSAGKFPPRQQFAEEAPPDGIDEDESGNLYARLLLDSLITTIAVVMHRTVYDRVGGFDESLRTGEDYDFWLKASHDFAVCKLNRRTALYRIHSNSTTNVPRVVNNEYLVVCRAIERFGLSGRDGSTVSRDLVNRRLARLCFQHGYMHYRSGDPCVAACAFLQSLRHLPLQLKTCAHAVRASARCTARHLLAR